MMSIKINFAGDIALFKRFEEKGIDPLEKVFLPAADYNVANFEFIQPRDSREKSFFAVNEEYKCSYNYFKNLKLDRFDAYGMANNHAMDYGVDGNKDVVEVLRERGIETFGVSDGGNDSVLVVDIKGISFAFIGGTSSGRWSKEHWGYGPESSDANRIVSLIKKYRKEVDHVVPFLHWGSELVDVPPPEVIGDAKRMVDSGASAVIGHHPHVTHGILPYKNAIIATSLGSFIFLSGSEFTYEPDCFPRKVSCVLTLEFDNKSLISSVPVYYLYNPDTLLPEPKEKDEKLAKYIKYLDLNVENGKLYTKGVRNTLLRREVVNFIYRFKRAPFSTALHYIKYIKLRHFRKIIGFK